MATEKKDYTKYGDFSADGTEFVIKRPDTPRPWINYLSNGKYCLLLSQRGGGYSFWNDPELNRLTRWSPGSYLKDEPGRFLYVRDAESGATWSVTHNAARFRCRHGLGYTMIGSGKNGIGAEITFFVPEGVPCEVWQVNVHNESKTARTLQLFPIVELMPGNYFPELNMRNIHVLMNRAEFDHKTQSIAAWRLPWGNKAWPYRLFYGMSLPVRSFDTDFEFFMGRYGGWDLPAAVKAGRCTGSDQVCGVNLVGGLQGEMTLKPGETKTFSVVLGMVRERSESRELLARFRNPAEVSKALAETQANWRKLILDNVLVETPDKDFNLACNVWLKYQTVMNNHWGRSATYYHEGCGEFGYRNTAQDAWAMTAIDAKYALARLVKLSESQWKTGQPLPGWSQETGANTHKPPSDFPIWLPMLLMQYVKETGDLKILDKPVKFHDGPAASLYEHSRRATHFLLNVAKSKRGLPLMGSQDWNDAFDRTGIGGKGESVWLAIGLCHALRNMQELARAKGDMKTLKEFAAGYERMKKLVNRYGWDGGWYVYAFNDYGEPIGSRKNKESRVQLNSQTWAILAGLPDAKQLKSILKVIDKDSETPYGPVLFTPWYSQYNGRIGRITAFAPGTKENAAVFSHAGAFKAVADTKIGRGDMAYKTFKQLLPMSANKRIELFKTEPYVLPEYVIGPGNPRFGEGAFTWLTGSSDWLFMCGTQHILGVRPEFDGLLMDPCLPKHWKRCRVRRQFRGATYDIEILNPNGVQSGVKYVEVDDVRQTSPLVAPKSRGVHRVTVMMG